MFSSKSNLRYVILFIIYCIICVEIKVEFLISSIIHVIDFFCSFSTLEIFLKTLRMLENFNRKILTHVSKCLDIDKDEEQISVIIDIICIKLAFQLNRITTTLIIRKERVIKVV